MSCDVGKVREWLENELWHRWSDGKLGEWAELHHSSFSNPSVASPTPQLILQPFRCFIYITAHSPTLLLLLLHHRIFTYVTWQAAHGRQRPLLKMSPTARDETSRGRNPENGRRRDLGRRRRYRQSGFQHTDRPRPSSLELFNKDHNAGRGSLSHLNCTTAECKNISFYFRATLGMKEVLQSSKNSTSIFWWFFILHHSHILKRCFRKMCVCVCVCVCVCLCERRRM